MTRLNVSLFDTFQVTLDDTPIQHFRSSNNQGLLAYLMLHGDRPLPRDVLATLFWPEESEQNAHNNLRQSLYQLRKLLGDLEKTGPAFLLVTRQTVQFNPESDYVLDVDLFLHAVEAGDLETAVSHYHGDLLPGFASDSVEFETWLRQEREHLHRLALEAMFEVTQTHLQHGRFDKAQTSARKQLSLESWREQAHRQLMQAFALAGDRSNALTQYEVCRQTLREELDIEPAAETTALFTDIKSGRYGAVASEESIRPPVKVRHNLPADTTPLIGRELEIDQIGQLLIQNEQRLVTIVGPGGMGKTRLALAVGSKMLAHYRDGVYFVDLAAMAQPEEIPLAVAAAMDYQAPDKSQELFPQLLNMLSRSHLLLILDNFEHLLSGAALINDILQSCPHLSILVTSRQRLNLASESRFELGGLDYPDWLTPEHALDYTAIQLFVDNGRRVKTGFALTDDNVADVCRIGQLVQGMPLGLVLAAAWLEVLTPSEIVTEIESRLDFLAVDLADLPPRQRSMQAVFERSWQLLTTVEQATLARLSIFRGGFTREAAEQVAGANLRILLALVNKSHLQRQTESGRFTMHELLRQFAASQRRQDDSHAQVELAHCRYFAGLVRMEIRQVLDFYPLLLPRHHGADRDNLRCAWDYALEHGSAEELPALTQGVAFFYLRQGIPPASIAEQAIQTLQSRGIADTDIAMLRLRLIALTARIGLDDHHVLKDQLLAFVPLADEHGDPELRFWTFNFLARLCINSRDPEAIAFDRKAYQVVLEMEDTLLVRSAEAARLWHIVDLGSQDAAAHADLQTMLPYFEHHNPDSVVTYGILWALCASCAASGEFAQAIHYGRRSLNIAKRWQDLFWISHSIHLLATTYLRMGLPHEAGLEHLDALEWHQATGQVWQMLGFLWSKAVDHPQLVGGREAAVSILSMVYHHPETPLHYRQKIDEARPKFQVELGEESFAAAWQEGKRLDFETAVLQVQSALAASGMD